jgi:hypothetical protein
LGAECDGDPATAGEVEAARSGLARFVGIEAYEASGGVVRRDLFDSEQSRFLCDSALLQRLATEKLEATADAVRAEGWGWVEVRLDVGSHALRQFSPAEYDLRKPRPGDRKELAELARRSRELEQQGDALGEHHEGWADEAEAIDLEEQDIAARQRAIQHGLDMADWWEPTAEGFPNHVSKAQIVQALREAGPDLAADGVEMMKNDALVTTALARLKGRRWLPEPLRSGPG